MRNRHIVIAPPFEIWIYPGSPHKVRPSYIIPISSRELSTSVVWFLQEFDSFFLCKSSTHLFAAGVRLIFLCKSSTHFARAKIMQEFDSFLCLQEFNSFCSSENHARVRLIFMLARVQLILLERKSCKSSTHFEACKS